MKIVYFSPHPTHDTKSDVGYSTHQREMIKALRELGHEVIPVIIGNELHKLESQGLMDYTKPSNTRQFFKQWIPRLLWQTLKDLQMLNHGRKIARRKLRQALAEHKPDAVYERSEILLPIGVEETKRIGIPHIYELNGPGVEEMIGLEGRSLLNNYAHKLEKRKFSFSDRICVVSTSLKAYIEDRYSVSPAKIHVIPNAYNPEYFEANAPVNKSLQKALGLDDNDIVLGFVGSILPFHGVDLLIKAFIEVSEKYPNSKLLVVGDGMSLEGLKKLALEVGGADRVIFAGKVSHAEVYDYIRLMDVTIMPKSNWYGSPVKIFEYGAMSKAIVAPNVAPVRDVIKDGEHAILTEPTTKALVEAITLLLSNPDLITALASQFYSLVKRRHTWHHNARELSLLLNEIINKKTPETSSN